MMQINVFPIRNCINSPLLVKKSEHTFTFRLFMSLKISLITCFGCNQSKALIYKYRQKNNDNISFLRKQIFKKCLMLLKFPLKFNQILEYFY